MKKSLFAVALMAMSAMAFAHGNGNNHQNNGGAAIGGSATVYGGTITAGATSVNHGEAVSATFISGNGYSNQFTKGSTIGAASAGGSIGSNGVAVNTATFQKTDFSSTGSIGGGAEAMNAGSQILNGTQGFGSVKNDAAAAGSFVKGSIGGFAAIGGVTIGNFHGF